MVSIKPEIKSGFPPRETGASEGHISMLKGWILKDACHCGRCSVTDCFLACFYVAWECNRGCVKSLDPVQALLNVVLYNHLGLDFMV